LRDPGLNRQGQVEQTGWRLMMVVITSQRDLMVLPQHSIISRRMRILIAALIARLRIIGQRQRALENG